MGEKLNQENADWVETQKDISRARRPSPETRAEERWVSWGSQTLPEGALIQWHSDLQHQSTWKAGAFCCQS